MSGFQDKFKSKSSPSSGGSSAVVAISLVGVFVIGFIFLLAKGLFTSNTREVPQGLDTATINTDITGKTESAAANPAAADVSSSQSENSGTDMSSQTSSASSAAENYGKMYVTQYAYLHTKPDNNAENIVCMSPGVEVTVLNFEDNGYVKITFMNIDGQLTGYIYKDYLASYDTQANNAQQNAQPVQTDVPADTAVQDQ